jgi:tRNA threonylcarbamoyladenosine biosynthesis protein TsaE
MQIVIISNSADFTKDLGKKLTRFLSKGSIILFTGELGGGKTTFISGIAAGLGLREDLSSPSFTILNEYHIGGQMKLVHADLYRLEDIDDINGTGLNDYIYDGFSIICVEWGDRIRNHIKREFLEIDIRYLIDSSNISTNRKITFKSDGPYWDLKLSRFKKLIKKVKD